MFIQHLLNCSRKTIYPKLGTICERVLTLIPLQTYLKPVPMLPAVRAPGGLNAQVLFIIGSVGSGSALMADRSIAA